MARDAVAAARGLGAIVSRTRQMACRYCHIGTDLVEAHVIPAGFFRRLREPDTVPRLLTNNDGEYPRRAPNGVYDRTILGSCCEPRFGPWDQYAQEVLQDDPQNASVLRVGSMVVGYELADWRYDLLKLFFVSLAWRASVSTHRMFERIRLGPYELAAKELLDRSDPGSPEDFAVTLAKFDHRLGSAILDPHPDKPEGVNYLRFYLGTYVAYIKVDRRLAPAPFSQFLLAPGQPLKIIGRDLLHSPEFSVIRDIAAKPKNR